MTFAHLAVGVPRRALPHKHLIKAKRDGFGAPDVRAKMESQGDRRSFPQRNDALVWYAKTQEPSCRQTPGVDSDVLAVGDRGVGNVCFYPGERSFVLQLCRRSASGESRGLAVLDTESTGSRGTKCWYATTRAAAHDHQTPVMAKTDHAGAKEHFERDSEVTGLAPHTDAAAPSPVPGSSFDDRFSAMPSGTLTDSGSNLQRVIDLFRGVGGR
jgi:hypothetical protein